MEKAINILSFSLSLLSCGSAPPNLKDTFLGILKDKVVSHLKEHETACVTNKIINLINDCFSEKIKEQLFNLDLLKLDDIDNEYISYDIIINRDFFQCHLIDKFKEVISDIESLMDFLGPIIDFIKGITDGNKYKMEKFNNFLNFVKIFDFKRCNICLVEIIEKIKNTKIEYKIDNDLFALISKSNEDFTEDKINNLIRELIECGAIDKKKGIFNMEFIEKKDFVQSFNFANCS